MIVELEADASGVSEWAIVELQGRVEARAGDAPLNALPLGALQRQPSVRRSVSLPQCVAVSFSAILVGSVVLCHLGWQCRFVPSWLAVLFCAILVGSVV